MADGSSGATFRACDLVVTQIPSFRCGPIAVGTASDVRVVGAGDGPPERRCTELKDGGDEVESAVGVLPEFDSVDMWAFGLEHSGADLLREVSVPKR